VAGEEATRGVVARTHAGDVQSGNLCTICRRCDGWMVVWVPLLLLLPFCTVEISLNVCVVCVACSLCVCFARYAEQKQVITLYRRYHFSIRLRCRFFLTSERFRLS